MSDHKQIIIKFKKDASSEAKQKTLDDIKAKGGQITKDDNLNSSIFPFVAVSLPEEHFNALHSETIGGHHAIDHVEEDGEMRIQS